MTLQNKSPVILLTGFLGSGKTTFLNRLLATDAFDNSLMIVNEFGTVGIDHHLVEHCAETLLELPNGCACCSVRGELVKVLVNQALEKYERVIIETTGIADPLPIFQSLACHPMLAQKLMPASVVTVFDTVRGCGLIEQHIEATHQIGLADTIVLTKTDMPGAIDNAQTQLRSINDTANFIPSSRTITPEELARVSTNKIATQRLDHHSSAYQSTVLCTDKPVTIPLLSGLLHVLINHFGEKLLRIKGFSRVEGETMPLVVQVSGNIVHDFEPMKTRTSGLNTTQLVVITKQTDPQIVQDLFSAFLGEIVVNTPDRDALANSPVVIPSL